MNYKYKIVDLDAPGTAWLYFEIDVFSHDNKEKGLNYILEVLTDISNKNELIKNKENWGAISYKKAEFLLENGFRYDLAYTSCENDTKENARRYTSRILDMFSALDTVCLSNTSSDLWKGSAGWNSITNHTFDLGVLITDFKKIIVTVFVGED
ncbi:hypothetical protein SAMN04489761_3569 [Tenacibaculum sp. MAR_2009_124]|uniref:hypothetical protein n=1 Tax=Tenacibaculum sp. MAR_2009_124 TaxID=1250059 RepID=UPI00089B8796|nr:hypothetical protein [Tenacibaculum sp. MAR_2009_124]SEC78335.1 hypothetical protein SAMN04489761_3569 [Tenacibaculum sp. MAR_2009_124]